MNRYSMAVLAGMIAAGGLLPARSFAQALNENVITAQARAFGPKSDGGPSIEGIPVADIRWLLDREAIRETAVRYTRGIDRHDAILLASAFWPDAIISYGDTFSGPRDEFVRWALADDAKRMRAHGHNITQQIVDIDGDSAHAESYILALEQHMDGTAQLITGRYIDRLQRRNGEWRILVRRFLLDMRAVVDGSTYVPGKSCLGACGSMDRNDPSYQRPLMPRSLSKPKIPMGKDQ